MKKRPTIFIFFMVIFLFTAFSHAQMVGYMNEPGSLIAFPLVDNITYSTIINITNTGLANIMLECNMATHGPDNDEIDEKTNFIIRMTPKEEFWWNTSTRYNRVNAHGNRVQIRAYNDRKGYLFCWAIDSKATRLEIPYNHLSGNAIVFGGQHSFSYDAIPSQALNVVQDRFLNIDGFEYTTTSNRIMFRGFAARAFGVMEGTLAVANIGINYVKAIQPEFNINLSCWNQDEIRFSNHLHFKDFKQYDLSDDLKLNLESIFTEGFQCEATSTHLLWAVFYQTAGPDLAIGGNVWHNLSSGASTRITLPLSPPAD